jgi:hypothetical protein
LTLQVHLPPAGGGSPSSRGSSSSSSSSCVSNSSGKELLHQEAQRDFWLWFDRLYHVCLQEVDQETQALLARSGC